MIEFQSKVDGWFVTAAAVTIAAAALALLVSLEEGSLAGLLLAPAPVLLVVWIWLTTRYVVTDSELLVRCAFVRTRIPLDSITHLRRTATVLSGPALSLDRVEVQHTGGSVVISPRDRVRFLQALATRCPHLSAEAVLLASGQAPDLPRARRMATLTLVPLALAAVAGIVAVSSWTPDPVHVTVSDEAVTVESAGTIEMIPLAMLVAVNLEDALPAMRKRFGWNSRTTLRGRFVTSAGPAFVHVSRGTPPYLVMRTNYSVTIVNFDDPQRTRKLYQDIVSRRPVTFTDEVTR